MFSSALAQGPAGAGAGTRRGSARRADSTYELSNWQVAVGYQFNRENLLGTPFDTNGLNVSVVRYFSSWLGAEGQLGLGFGNTGTTTVPSDLSAKSIIVGAGPRMALRGHRRFEPWIHANIGVEHFRFSQTAGVLGTNNALAAVGGGGVDFRLNPRTSFRAEVDWIGSRFFSTSQRSFQMVTGLVVNF
jgi:predicted porin